MSLEQKALAFAQLVGADIGELIATRGDLSTLTTTQKGSLVAAINELRTGLSNVDLTAIINDAGTGTNVAWSVDKIISMLNAAKNEIINGAPEAYNTLKEIADYIAANDIEINNLLVDIGNRVRYDAAQTLTTAEQLQACVNIGINDNLVDLVGFYSTSKGTGTTPVDTGNNFAFDSNQPASSPGVTGNNFNF